MSTTSLNTIHQIAVYSSDLDRSIAFYRDQLGAQFIAKFDPPGLAFFQFGKTRLLLEKNGPRATLYFWVDDIAKSFESLRAKGIQFDSEPKVIHRDKDGTFGPPGTEEWMAFFRDPDGNILAIASQSIPKS
jgi:methylmalonyl-CoA/ethylmalonyl-CoA epimerase